MTNRYNQDLVIDIESSGPYPWDGKIVCVGCKNCKDSEVKIFHDDNEEKLIIEFLQYFNRNKFTRLIGYNVAHDYRFLVSKCLKYRIALVDFQYVKLVDVMKILKGSFNGHNFNLNRPGNLNQWSKFLIGRGKLIKDKSVKDLLSENRINEILEYNRVDVELTFQIWDRINQVMVV